MSDVSESVRVYGCQWAWCRLNFSDNDALGNHVVFEHVRRAIPVRRKEIPMLRRAEEGLGDSLKISDIMRDPLSQRSELSKDPVSSQQQPPSSSLPSPPASSPVFSLQDKNFLQGVEQELNVHPFTSLSSPAGSLAYLKNPTSPAFNTPVRRTNKRKEAPKTHGCLSKLSKHDSLSQESAASTGSHRSVEEHLTQASGRDEEEGECDENTDARDEWDTGDSQDAVMITPTSGTTSSPPSSQREAYKGELNWDMSHVLSTQFETESSIGSSQEKSANPFLDSMSQPPSQLQLSSPIYHIHRTQTPPSQLQTTQNDTVLSLPLNPVALSSPTGFTASTPQRQTWYQPALRRRVSSRSPSGETTPKPSRNRGTPPTSSEEQSQEQQSVSKVRVRVPSTPRPVRGSPFTKKSVFRSGTLQVTHPSMSPLQSPSPSQPQPMAPHIIVDESSRSIATLFSDIFTIPEDTIDSQDAQSQFDQQPSMSGDLSPSSYPALQTQAPYQSPDFSQLD